MDTHARSPSHAPPAPAGRSYEVWIAWAALIGLGIALVALRLWFDVLMPIYCFVILVFICYVLGAAKVERPGPAPD